jgi:beta-phosphoglucomutase-like phosphatase (HAD superfamily)
VIWDLDGTLLDTESLSDAAMLSALSPPPSVLSAIGSALPNALKRATLGLPSEQWAPLVLDFFRPLYPPDRPLSLTAPELAARWETALGLLLPSALPMPGALPLAAGFASLGLPQAIATSSSAGAVEEKRRAAPKLFGLMSSVTCGDDPDLKKGKPAPDIFLLAAARLSLPPESCLAFEDSLAGCRAAKAAGCRVVAVPDRGLCTAEDLAAFAGCSDALLPSLALFDPAAVGLPPFPPPRPPRELPASWTATTTVDRADASSLSVPDFISRYEKPGRPLVLTGVVPSWPAATSWKLPSLLSRFPDTKFRVSATRDMTLGQFAAYCEEQEALPSSLRDERPLYLFDKDFAAKAPGMAGEFEIPPYFAEDLMAVLPQEARPDHRWLIVGPRHSGSSFHVDPNANFAWNATLQGRKKWVFYPPGCEPARSAGDERQVDLVRWFEDFYDDDPNAHLRQECVSEAGECVYVPRGWWHCVLNLDVSVALTHNVVTSRNLAHALDFLGDTASCAPGEGCRGNVKFNYSGDVPTSVIYPYKDAVIEAAASAGAAESAGSPPPPGSPCDCSEKTRALHAAFVRELRAKRPGVLEEA